MCVSYVFLCNFFLFVSSIFGCWCLIPSGVCVSMFAFMFSFIYLNSNFIVLKILFLVMIFGKSVAINH